MYRIAIPQNVVNHCMDRLDNAKPIADGNIQLISEHGGFLVKSQSTRNLEYYLHVDYKGFPTCYCFFWKEHHLPCKHFLAVFMHY